MTKPVSRLAPSPTGALHLGNARTFLINWALARNDGWRLLMRIEDLDGPRIKPESVGRTLEILQWLGLDYDGSPLIQSADLSPYEEALRELAAQRRAYACRLTRREIEQAASAPHAGDHEVRFPPDSRPSDERSWRWSDARMNCRFLVPDETIEINDLVQGRIALRPCAEVGDFVIWTKRGTPSYQLAVAVDDARQGVTEVVRGHDLLPSAARQVLLYRALGWTPPRWWHLPLVLGTDGRRLAKRHGDTRLECYRELGVPPERVVGLLASWCGIGSTRGEISAEDFRQRFEVARLSREPVVFSEDDHAWLLAGGSQC
jgi:glutamyl-tRNA synthetase